jgi:hypothetical protein
VKEKQALGILEYHIDVAREMSKCYGVIGLRLEKERKRGRFEKQSTDDGFVSFCEETIAY